MTGIYSVVTPARLAFRGLGERTKGVRGRGWRRVNITTRQRKLATAQLERRLKTFDRLRDAALGQPLNIRFGSVGRNRIRWHLPATGLRKFLQALPRSVGQIPMRLSVITHKRIEVNQLPDSIPRP